MYNVSHKLTIYLPKHKAMSGGRFDYNQYRLTEIADQIEQEIADNTEFSKKTIQELTKAVELIRTAQIYAHRIDWLLCGDDSEDTFHERLSDDLINQKHNA